MGPVAQIAAERRTPSPPGGRGLVAGTYFFNFGLFVQPSPTIVVTLAV